MNDPVVNQAIIAVLMPQLYAVIDELLAVGGDTVPKKLRVTASKLLPKQYSQSIEKPKQVPA